MQRTHCIVRRVNCTCGCDASPLAALDFPEPVASDAVWFLYIFPTSFFLHIDYTESLLLLLVVSAFLAARYRDWALAGVLGMLASLTHNNGVYCWPRRLDWRR